MIFDDCILEDDWNDGKVFWNGKIEKKNSYIF
jgi:hypothetical protein